jgi:hypothetical protein
MHLEPEDQDYLRPEVSAFLDRLDRPETRLLYEPLIQAVEEAEVPDDLLRPLGTVLELSLGSGRLRTLHGAHASMRARTLFQQTPQGRALRESTEEANQALTGLRDQILHAIEFTPNGPGKLTLTIETDRCRAQLIIDSSGVRMQGVELDF